MATKPSPCYVGACEARLEVAVLLTAKSPTRAIACITLCLWGGIGVVAHAEVREVSIAEIVREFCAVVVANESHYVKAIEACFPNESQDTDTRKSCRAVINSVTRVINEFYKLRESSDVKLLYYVSYDWTPPASFLERWKCEFSEGTYETRWSCPGFSKEEVQIASQEAICADAFKAENRIGKLVGNANRADQLLTVKGLRVVGEETGGGWLFRRSGRSTARTKRIEGVDSLSGAAFDMKSDRRIELTGWQGATTGLRVAAESRSRVFEPLEGKLAQVRIGLPRHRVQPLCRITPTFWTTCPELRSAEIGRWMVARGDKPWPRGRPPRYEAEFVGVDGRTMSIRIVE